MSAQHTPGPYAIFRPGEGGNEGPNLEIHDGFGRTATVYGEIDDPETTATASLLAAAPELLAALEAVMDPNHKCGVDCDRNLPCPLGEKARAAIAKARGES